MEQKNLDFLKKQLDELGAGNMLNKSLEKEMAAGKAQFTLQIENKEANSKHASVATLQFAKPEGKERYYFQQMHMELKDKDGQTVRDHHFRMYGDQNNVTLKEAVNLLEGRAVNKDLTSREGKSYNTWVALDLEKPQNAYGSYPVQQFYGKRSIDVEQRLGKMGISEVHDSREKARVVTNLKLGNDVMVTVNTDLGGRPMVIEVAPDKGKIVIREKEPGTLKDLVRDFFGKKPASVEVKIEPGQRHVI